MTEKLDPTPIGETGIIVTSSKDCYDIAAIMMKAEIGLAQKRSMSDLAMSIAAGKELGLGPVQAVGCIAVINGKATVHSDGLNALVTGSKQVEWIREWWEIDGEVCQAPVISDASECLDSLTACWQAKRKDMGEPLPVCRFSVADAKLAGLWGRNTWAKYPKRMLQRRAFGTGARDGFAEFTKGLWLREEAMDMRGESHDNDKTLDNRFDTIDVEIEDGGELQQSDSGGQPDA